jgi:hypothetical protein
VTDRLVSDFDFHPDEPYVRQFRVPRRDALRWDASVFVCEAAHDDVVLRHYAFADEWFKVNVTFDRHGELVETPADHDVAQPFAFNCDIATPMLSEPFAVYGVDLFLDVLVRVDGSTYDIVDEDEFAHAVDSGLLSAGEVAGARRGLERLVQLITRDELVGFLESACPFGPSTARSGAADAPSAAHRGTAR